MTIDFNTQKRIFSNLKDEYSRYLYEKRVMWSLTGEYRYIDDIISSLIDKDRIDRIMSFAYNVRDRLAIRGAGNDYWILKKQYPNLEFRFFVDNDPAKQGHYIDGKSVITPGEFYESYADMYVLVNSTGYNEEIVSELLDHGIDEAKIINIGKSYEKICNNQYFDTDIIKPVKDEVFIDGGCYDGGTIRKFVKWCRGNYKKVYAFEPDPANYELLMQRMPCDEFNNIQIYNKGLWNVNGEISFDNNGTQGSRVSASGKSKIETVFLDNVVNGDKVTFLKLDVEGAEYEALQGARETIIRYHPRLAVSLYHKPEDIFTLPEIVLSMYSGYSFWIRHYQLSQNETILYAIPDTM